MNKQHADGLPHSALACGSCAYLDLICHRKKLLHEADLRSLLDFGKSFTFIEALMSATNRERKCSRSHTYVHLIACTHTHIIPIIEM